MVSLQKTITIKSPGKLNLTFDIVGTLAGGYHEVETLMQAISLEDELEFEFDFSSDRFIFELAGMELYSPEVSVPKGANNLISRAAHQFYEHCGTNRTCKISCKLKKRIPVAGGMGGGSGNAAATLVALDQAFETHMSQEQLSHLAGELGADAPFFLSGGTQIGRHKGDMLSPVSPAEEVWFVIISPGGLSLQTAQIYADYDAWLAAGLPDLLRPDLDYAVKSMQSHSTESRAELINFDHGFANVFTDIVWQKHPRLKELADKIAAVTGKAVHMTGSGPTLFVCASSQDTARQLADLIESEVNEAASEKNGEQLLVAPSPRPSPPPQLQAFVWTACSIPHGVKVSSSTIESAS